MNHNGNGSNWKLKNDCLFFGRTYGHALDFVKAAKDLGSYYLIEMYIKYMKIVILD